MNIPKPDYFATNIIPLSQEKCIGSDYPAEYDGGDESLSALV
jgi:hypothetical protein